MAGKCSASAADDLPNLLEPLGLLAEIWVKQGKVTASEALALVAKASQWANEQSVEAVLAWITTNDASI